MTLKDVDDTGRESRRAYFQAEIVEFLETNESEILGELAKRHSFALELLQRNAWLVQIAHLKKSLQDFTTGYIFLEFEIPRMGKRADVLLAVRGVLFVLEYKVGAKTYEKHAIDQVTDYALDLKNFHRGSHHKYIVPILVATAASSFDCDVEWADDKVSAPLRSDGNNLARLVNRTLNTLDTQPDIDATEWARDQYQPTPTIVEAAQSLYRGHSVESISRSDAGAINLSHTTRAILRIVDECKNSHRKSICFVTGVPGAGKTLAGLNISTRSLSGKRDENAVFLSGNGPLVTVLREALARNEVARNSGSPEAVSKKKAISRVSTFIQNIHHFRDDGLKSDRPPIEHVVVFDEAQRAWNRDKAEKFMSQKRGYPEFGMSEPEFLISLMDRHPDWCTVVCLIGGGQEINTGEAGLGEWFEAVNHRFRHWKVFCPEQIVDRAYDWNSDIARKIVELNVEKVPALHLAVSIRSYRAEKLSDCIAAMIDGDSHRARELHQKIAKDYPIVITRDLHRLRRWLREKARGSERYGLVASSGAARLKPVGVNVKAGIETEAWFLNDKEDVRSSFYLEDAATEFEVQGLEMDWAGVCWEADFRRDADDWRYFSFKGAKWQSVNDPMRRRYLANTYRVLLTRARQGMAICVPDGDDLDHTRPREFYDHTYSFLQACGLAEI